VAASTPKFKSKEFKRAVAAVKSIFDAHSLGVVLLDALERKAAEQIYGKIAGAGGRGRLANVPKMELVGQITGWFFSSDDVAYKVMKEMDRACQKERHIVASIPEEQAPERVGSYRAIAFKRERAKFVWALSRDERESVRTLANRIINEFFAEVADLEKARAITDGDESSSPAEDVELAKRLQQQAERLGEATEQLTDLQSKLSKFEEERAKLLVAVGAKERSLKQQAEAREGLEDQLTELRSRLDDLDTKELEAAEAKEAEVEARAAAEELAQKVRRLEKLAGAAENLSAVSDQLDKAKKELDDERRQRQRDASAYQRERGELDKERGRLRADLDGVREDLKRARKRIADLESGAADRPERQTGDAERVAILVDQANLAAVASQCFKRKVNFSALYERLRKGRKVAKAVAFVVDNGGTAFDAFCDTLRRSGWELRIKKPKRFSDGRSKADWDMGMAMEAIDLTEKVDTVVLVSGDGDFAPLVRRLQRSAIRVEVAAFPEGLANELSAVADDVDRLDHSALE